MIIVPADRIFSDRRAYRDSSDAAVVYLDALQPRMAAGETVRWLPIPTQQAYMVCEVEFGASSIELQKGQEFYPNCRILPMSWSPSVVYLWGKLADGVQRLAIGKTSGYGRHNAILNATADIKAVTAPITIAAELLTQVQLSPAVRSVRAEGNAEGMRSVQFHAADESATVSDVLTEQLRQLVAQGELQISIAPVPSDSAEVQSLVLMEWAHRIGQAAGIESIACPAALQSDADLHLPDLQIHWGGGELIPLRTVRKICPESIVSGY